MVTALILATLLRPNGGGVVGVINGPKAGVLARGEPIVLRECFTDVDGWQPLIIEMRRGTKVLATTNSRKFRAQTGLRMVKRGQERFVVFVGGGGTSNYRNFVLIRRNPLVLKEVGSFGNAAIANFSALGTVRAYPRHSFDAEDIPRTKENRNKWICYTYKWDPVQVRFAKIGRKIVDKQEPEAKRFFQGIYD